MNLNAVLNLLACYSMLAIVVLMAAIGYLPNCKRSQRLLMIMIYHLCAMAIIGLIKLFIIN